MTMLRAIARPGWAPLLFGAALVAACFAHGQTADTDLPLPDGADGVWDMAKAWTQASATRDSICINGLWRFYPIIESADINLPPRGSGWGWFKVPGIWPYSDNFQVDAPAQEALLPRAVETRMREKNRWFDRLDQAWYQRDIVVPDTWNGRRVLLNFTLIQSRALVLVDGREAGEVLFPGARLDITPLVQPGKQQTVTVLLTARPLRDEEKTTYMGPDVMIQGSDRPSLVGITGDVFLESEPPANAISDVQVVTSTRKMAITFDVGIANLTAPEFALSATVFRQGKVVRQFTSGPLNPANLKDGRVSFSSAWTDPLLWDTDTPENMYEAAVTIADAKAGLLDETLPIRFGFREFWIDGKDFYLNGSRIHLRARMLKNAITMADKARMEGCRTVCRYMKEYGYNFFLTPNYGFSPGDVGYLDALYGAADESGLLCSFSLPHSADFGWLENPEQQARYQRLTTWLIRRIQNHPSIITYAANHNATGYSGDQNPLKMDGVYLPPENRRRHQALVSVGLINAIDATRPVYNHHSGNLGDFYTVNIYLNWAPRQERSEWLAAWAANGKKPMFFAEWGPPHSASWSSFRGPGFIWAVPAFQQIWDSEFASEYVGQGAFQMTPLKIKSLEKEEAYWATGQPFPFWLLRPYFVQQEQNYVQVQSYMMDDNLRSLRTWGISAIYPFDEECLWLRTKETQPQPFPSPYRDLQQPGIVPDRIMPSKQYFYDPVPANFAISSLGRTFKRWNMPVVCYIGGGPALFTEKSHQFLPGEIIRKQLVLLNDTRRILTIGYSCRFSPATPATVVPSRRASAWSMQGSVRLEPGASAFVPVAVPLPTSTDPGGYLLSAAFDAGMSGQQTDSLSITVLPINKPDPVQSCKIALFDPKGMTTELFKRLGLGFTAIDDRSALEGYDVLVIGREAITLGNDLPSLDRLPQGMKVLVFEQSEEALQQRLGFRIQTRGIRNAFVRVPGCVALEGLAESSFADWRGAATLVEPHFSLPDIEETYPTVRWCGFENTRVWRNGNNGNVASVVIEKPSRGNWLPLLDCGFDLQYSPLLEYREGRGRMVFCQLDVTGRTLPEPAADQLCRNLLRYLATARPATERTAYYAGAAEGAELLTKLGVAFAPYRGQTLDSNTVLVVAPGGGRIADLAQGLQNGTNLLALGLEERSIPGLGVSVGPMRTAPVVSSLIRDFDPPEFTGISNAELYARTLRLPVTQFADTTGSSNQILKCVRAGAGRAVFCQTAPWMFDYAHQPYLRTTYRRNVFLVARLLSNLGAPSATKLASLWREKGPDNVYLLANPWRGRIDREGIGQAQGWWQPAWDDQAWRPVKVPGSFAAGFEELHGDAGRVWYRTRFALPDFYRRKAPTLYLGKVSDESWVWLNGEFLGEVTRETNPQSPSDVPRAYRLDPGKLKTDGENVLVVLANRTDARSPGGILGRPAITIGGRWLESYYLQEPQADDDPYRYYRW